MLSRHSAGTYQGKRAHTRLVRKLSATDSPLSHCGPILALKKKVELLCASRSPLSKKSAGGKSIVKNFPPKILASKEKATAKPSLCPSHLWENRLPPKALVTRMTTLLKHLWQSLGEPAKQAWCWTKSSCTCICTCMHVCVCMCNCLYTCVHARMHPWWQRLRPHSSSSMWLVCVCVCLCVCVCRGGRVHSRPWRTHDSFQDGTHWWTNILCTLKKHQWSIIILLLFFFRLLTPTSWHFSCWQSDTLHAPRK